MSETFVQEIHCRWTTPAPEWRIAADVLDLLEGAFGDHWKGADVRLTATSTTQITFYSDDLVSLEAQVDQYGGRLRNISLNVDAFLGNQYLSAAAFIWLADGDGTDHMEIDWHMPTRLDVESFGFSIDRTLNAYKRRRRWSEATWRTSEVTHRSRADGKPSASPILSPRKARWTVRRWFVRNRDNLIISLGGGLAISWFVILLQQVGVIPTPGS